jgi:hypothetical protein
MKGRHLGARHLSARVGGLGVDMIGSVFFECRKQYKCWLFFSDKK